MGRKSRRVLLWRAGNTICPICLHEFSFERDIRGHSHAHSATIEHVPPKALQGAVWTTVLTCRSCNEGAGQTVDHAIVDAAKGEHSGAIITDGERTPIRLSSSPQDTKNRMHRGRKGHDPTRRRGTTDEAPVLITLSHPATPQKVYIWSDSHLLPTLVGKRFQLQWRQRQFPEIGLLKSAYLTVYALLGIAYAQDPAVAAVRAQIQHPGRRRSPRDRSCWTTLQCARTRENDMHRLCAPPVMLGRLPRWTPDIAAGIR